MDTEDSKSGEISYNSENKKSITIKTTLVDLVVWLVVLCLTGSFLAWLYLIRDYAESGFDILGALLVPLSIVIIPLFLYSLIRTILNVLDNLKK